MKLINDSHTQQILDKEVIKQSSLLMNKLILNPKQYIHFSIDNICLTIPIDKKDIRELKILPKLIEAQTDLQVTAKELSGENALAAKFLYHIQITNKQGHSFSIFHTSLTNCVKDKSEWKHKHLHNEAKFDVNPNTFGIDNLRQVLVIIQQLWPSYHDLISRSRLTAIDLAADIPKLFTPHVICSYAYRSLYQGFFSNNEFTGFRFGKKGQCPIKCYNKSLEQGGSYLGHKRYTRIERTYRPRVRKNKYITVETLELMEQGFRGLSFYDPKIFTNMPVGVLSTIYEYGLDKGKEMLSVKDRATLEQRMNKYKLIFGKEQKKQIVLGFKSAQLDVKNILLNPE